MQQVYGTDSARDCDETLVLSRQVGKQRLVHSMNRLAYSIMFACTILYVLVVLYRTL